MLEKPSSTAQKDILQSSLLDALVNSAHEANPSLIVWLLSELWLIKQAPVIFSSLVSVQIE